MLLAESIFISDSKAYPSQFHENQRETRHVGLWGTSEVLQSEKNITRRGSLFSQWVLFSLWKYSYSMKGSRTVSYETLVFGINITSFLFLRHNRLFALLKRGLCCWKLYIVLIGTSLRMVLSSFKKNAVMTMNKFTLSSTCILVDVLTHYIRVIVVTTSILLSDHEALFITERARLSRNSGAKAFFGNLEEMFVITIYISSSNMRSLISGLPVPKESFFHKS